MFLSCAGGRLLVHSAASAANKIILHVIRVELDIITTLSSAAGLI